MTARQHRSAVVSLMPNPWTWGLSNRALTDAYCRRLDEVWVEGRNLNADPDPRLEILHAEISRRERASDLSDDDWAAS